MVIRKGYTKQIKKSEDRKESFFFKALNLTVLIVGVAKICQAERKTVKGLLP